MAAVSYQLGAPVASANLPAAGTVDKGTGRIVTRYQTDTTGTKLLPTGWIDTQLGGACTVQSSASGLRCLPGYPAQELYSDSMCMNPVVFAAHPAGCAAGTPPPSYVTWPGAGSCAATLATRLFKVGALIPNNMLVFAKNGMCGSSSIDPHELDFYGASEIDTSTLPAITDVTE